MYNSFELCPTHFSRGEEHFVGVFASLVTDLGSTHFDKLSPNHHNSDLATGSYRNFHQILFQPSSVVRVLLPKRQRYRNGDSPRTGCAWRTTPYICVARTSNNRV